MDESNSLYWKRILKAMVERNRARLNDREYRTLQDALESKSDVLALRKVAIETAAALGRNDRNGYRQQFGNVTLNPTLTGC